MEIKDFLDLGVVGIIFVMWWFERRDGSDWKNAHAREVIGAQERTELAQQNVALTREVIELAGNVRGVLVQNSETIDRLADVLKDWEITRPCLHIQQRQEMKHARSAYHAD